MKNALLLLPLFCSVINGAENNFKPTNTPHASNINIFTECANDPKFKDHLFLKFVLSQKISDPKLIGIPTTEIAQQISQYAHSQVLANVKVSSIFGSGERTPGDFFKAGQSLNEPVTAKPLVHECAEIEKRVRATQRYGWVKGKSPVASIPGNYDGETFYKNACPSSFYKPLSPEELEQLHRGTKEKTYLKTLLKK